MKVKIANIVLDDKFIDSLFGSMALLNNKWENDYLIVRNNKPDSYKYIKNADRIIFVPKDAILEYLGEKKYDAVFLHSLPSLSIELIPKIDKKIKVFWFAWGWDIYQLPIEKPLIPIKLIKNETQKLLDSLSKPKKESLRSHLRAIKYRLFGSPSQKDYHEAVNRIDFFSGILEYEYDLMKSVKCFRAERVIFKYASLQYLKNFENPQLYNGQNILVGNSAASTNNHLDILPYLTKLNLEGKKIILPLSYSNTKEYIDHVAQKYIQELGTNVLVLKDFISSQEYSKLLQSCSVAIFFMERQQAIGNIDMTLRNGCKVFLSETNPVYGFYKGLGIKLFNIQYNLNQCEIDTPLSHEEIDINRNILLKRTNKQAFVKNLEKILDCINNSSNNLKQT